MLPWDTVFIVAGVQEAAPGVEVAPPLCTVGLSPPELDEPQPATAMPAAPSAANVIGTRFTTEPLR
jgi:hypothetical protein